MTTRFAVWQGGGSIFGLGSTPEEAISNAKKNIGTIIDIETYEEGKESFTAFYVSPCSEALYQHALYSSRVPFVVHKGMIMLEMEAG